MIIVLKTLVDIYKPQTKPDTLPKLIKRNVECKRTFESHSIVLEQYIKPNGEISKKWCNIKEGDGYYRINHSFEYVQNLIAPTYIKGFKRWT
tara:strand:- start:561 stop:836 length:276 start_codon:yes stop_codon:yes gene_type:complete